ncbi:MAG: MDR family MFS transporter [Desulfobacterales bacterium]
MKQNRIQHPCAKKTDKVNHWTTAERDLGAREKNYVIAAALLALFLGALDTLIMSAAMPTIVAELGSMHLYSWVYTAYFLARAVSLPIFGKLADLYKTKTLFLVSIGIFLIASVLAGMSSNMIFLIVFRVLQGIGAGGNFALVYIVLSDVSSPERRGKTLSLASSIWGIASILGPTIGGFIVTYFSWRWIFFINVPLGLLSLAGIAGYLIEMRSKKEKVNLDLSGVAILSVFILSFLMVFLLGGRTYAWHSIPIISLMTLTFLAAGGFYFVEKYAAEPILSLRFFEMSGFRIGNGAVFLSSFTIFSLFAYAPLYIQGALGKSPMMVGVGMLSLSLGWSVGSLVLGHMLNILGQRLSALIGSFCLVGGCGVSLFFTTETSMTTIFLIFLLIGMGMGFVTLSTLVVVQNCLDISDLGVATASHQFARTLGGTVGVGICGSFVTVKISQAAHTLLNSGLTDAIPPALISDIKANIENLFLPEVQAVLSDNARTILQEAIAAGVLVVFWIVLIAALICLCFCSLLPDGKPTKP